MQTTNIDMAKKGRFKAALKFLGLGRQQVATEIGYKKRYFDQILSGPKNLSDDVAYKFTKRYKKINLDWLLTGDGDMILEETSSYDLIHKDLIYVNDPNSADVDKLHEEIVELKKPTLNLKQSMQLKHACYKVMVENPGQPWGAWVVGAGVYLRYIINFPDLPLPD